MFLQGWRNNEFKSLRKGATEKALQAAEQLLGFPLPLHVKEVYRFGDLEHDLYLSLSMVGGMTARTVHAKLA